MRIAKGFKLTQDYVTKTVGILAQRRKGKTYTANVIAEEMVDAGIPWVALDPTGAWYGLRSSLDGKREGLPVTILGGDHGDVGLERTGGEVVADLVVDNPGHYVLDLSHFESKAAERQFATDFAERFYRRKAKSREAVHLFIDEADIFVPQQSPSGDQRMLGAFEAIVRRGGIRGIGVTLVSQRAAVINKNVLEQIDILIALRTVGPNDQKAIENYVKANGTEEERKTLMASLASLKLGEAWFWEPGAEPAIFKQVQIRERKTFNSSATPTAGGRRVEPRKMAPVDRAALEKAMAETIEAEKKNDPTELRKQIAQLQSELSEEQKKAPPEPERVAVQVPVVPEGFLDQLDRYVQNAKALGRNLIEEADRLARDVTDARKADLAEGHDFPVPAVPETPPKQAQSPAPPPPPAPTAAGDGEVKLNRRAERMVLSALIQYPEGLSDRKLAIITGYSGKGGGFRGAISKLRTAGYITPAGTTPMRATEAGIAALPHVEPLPTGTALFDYWMAQFNRRAEREVFRAIYDAHPNTISPEEVAAQAGYEPNGGGFRGALSKLRTLDLIEGRGDLKASDDLF